MSDKSCEEYACVYDPEAEETDFRFRRVTEEEAREIFLDYVASEDGMKNIANFVDDLNRGVSLEVASKVLGNSLAASLVGANDQMVEEETYPHDCGV